MIIELMHPRIWHREVALGDQMEAEHHEHMQNLFVVDAI